MKIAMIIGCMVAMAVLGGVNGFTEYPGTYYTISDCPYGTSSFGNSLETCKRKCADSTECTAVNFRNSGDGWCRLVNCNDPGTEPSGSHSDYTAYAIIEQQKPAPGDDNYCDCDYHLIPSGCKVSVAAPKNKACMCTNSNGTKCYGTVVSPCRWPDRDSCANPGKNKESCQQGGENSNCGGY